MKEINAIDYKNTWEPCEKLNCVHGHCFLMVEALSENWAYCECDEGFYGSDCQYTYGQSLKLNLKSTFFIDIEKGTVLDKINDFFNYNIIPKTIEEIYEVISMGKNLIDFYTNHIQTLLHNTFGEILSKTVKNLLLLTPLKKYDGIINFFGTVSNVIIDLFTRRLRNLGETQEELNLVMEQFSEINRFRGVKVLQEGIYLKKVERDKLLKILYISELIKADNISFYDWPEKYNKKCREHSFWNKYDKFAMVITEVTSDDFREIFQNPCLKKIYTLKDNINVEEKCLELLHILKDSFDTQEKKCYYNPKNIIKDVDNSCKRLLNKFNLILLLFILF